ncbi:glycosyltransferase N-terminal domain-containing protein [Rhizosaccharibacter radicis]|uniref:3-deoxy-D-manno-octulosonic acid transferase n=1 Tax=Rhizosaccharibacter radicis TaxID=2782605 RepID=A0ABT1VU34_9PROT|nr:DUF374 domain-containing protein [Acetobacteraceae bacterium KSS12]
MSRTPDFLKRTLRSDAARALFTRTVGAYLGLALRTTRWRVEAHPEAWPLLTGATSPGGRRQTAVVAFWHEQLPLLPVLWWHARAVEPTLTLHVLISRHRDGRLIADIVRRWNILAIAGSSHRREKDGNAARDKGGGAAFRTLLGLLRGGGLVAITPDGPRGPRRELQDGVLRMAALSGVPVVPVAARSSPSWNTASWDRMRLPLPFGRGRLLCGAPMTVPRHGWEEAAGPLTRALEALGDRLGVPPGPADPTWITAKRAGPDSVTTAGGQPARPDTTMDARARQGALAERSWSVLASLAAPALLLLMRRRVRRGKEIATRLPERRGQDAGPRPPGRLIWLHAASVGESMSLLPLIDALRRQRPGTELLVTTATVNAARLIEKRFAGQHDVRHRFAPLDVPRWIDRFLDRWRPDAAALVESELWPAMLAGCRQRGIPVALLNARLSDRSYRRWRKAGGLAARMLDGFDWIAARSAEDAARLRGLTSRPVEVPGDLKLAAAPLPVDEAERARLSALLAGRPVWLAASTHPGEEAAVRRLHDRLLSRHPALLTVLVPRHPERGAAIAAELAPVRRRSLGEDPPPEPGIWLCDTLDELGLFFRLVPVVVLGNSLTAAAGPAGGHNPFEPLRLGCAVASGPRLQNFRDAARELREAGALAIPPDEDALFDWLCSMLGDPAARRAMAERGAKATAVPPGLADGLASRVLGMMTQGARRD